MNASLSRSSLAKSSRPRRIQRVAVAFPTAGIIDDLDRSALSPAGMGRLLSAVLPASAVSQLTVGALLDRPVGKPLDGGETLIPTERTA
ncbi:MULTISPECIES: hypothetical protein [Methylobacterium]|uniref:hypothetical protein n=1 Tax=Methylobacterium TaxID=407 RepID=UPI0013E9C76C|nr:hypothetical protein [Methylobacterium sp. DB0501]NGM33803.1 hypothetical protein [Methylobacterium sp. DB0501]